MTNQSCRIARLLSLVFVLLLIFRLSVPVAMAADAEMEKALPTDWTLDVEEEAARGIGKTVLSLAKDGAMSLHCYNSAGANMYSFTGDWSFAFDPEYNDKLTLHFTSADHPTYTGVNVDVNCVFEAYIESWVENDTMEKYLILTQSSISGVSPFVALYGEDTAWELALRNVHGPDYRIVNCKDWVSMRETASAASARLAKVPLGAQVLAYPEYKEVDGFVYCVYQDQYGYIQSDYLERVD